MKYQMEELNLGDSKTVVIVVVIVVSKTQKLTEIMSW